MKAESSVSFTPMQRVWITHALGVLEQQLRRAMSKEKSRDVVVIRQRELSEIAEVKRIVNSDVEVA